MTWYIVSLTKFQQTVKEIFFGNCSNILIKSYQARSDEYSSLRIWHSQGKPRFAPRTMLLQEC